MLVVLATIAAALSLGKCSPAAVVEAVRGVGFSRPPAARITVAAPHADPVLQSRLEQTTSVSRGAAASYVLDLEHGSLAATNPDRSFRAASLFKLPILVEVLAQQQLHRLDPDQLLEIRPEDWADGSGVLQARVGDRLSVRELVRLMIQDSDNIAALVLLNAVGADNVNATLERMALRGTRVVDRRLGQQGDNLTTARDMGSLLTTIASGQLVDADVSESALKLLELKQASTWLAEDLPWWVKIAHKWGDLPEARHDAGIVFTPRGTFIAVVLTEDAPPDEAERAIARTGQAVYDSLR